MSTYFLLKLTGNVASLIDSEEGKKKTSQVLKTFEVWASDYF